MKKIPLLFLTSLIIFASFILYSLTSTPQNPPSKPSLHQNRARVLSTPTPSFCVITVNGQKYDVSQYRFQHSGGDIFTCNTDMSLIFTNQHSPEILNKMKRYLIP